jgi:hypothetical protein
MQSGPATTPRAWRGCTSRPLRSKTREGGASGLQRWCSRRSSGRDGPKRRGWDSNPRNGSAPSSGFQDAQNPLFAGRLGPVRQCVRQWAAVVVRKLDEKLGSRGKEGLRPRDLRRDRSVLALAALSGDGGFPREQVIPSRWLRGFAPLGGPSGDYWGPARHGMLCRIRLRASIQGPWLFGVCSGIVSVARKRSTLPGRV